MDETFTLAELAERSEVEARTIRSYIERGLLPNADSRGRGAGYTQEHLNRLLLIKSIKKARPSVQLNEIRLLFQQSTPDQIRQLVGGTVTAGAAAVAQVLEEGDVADLPSGFTELAPEEPIASETEAPAAALPVTQLTAVERLASALRQLSGPLPAGSGSKVEAWYRIPVTADIELTVRGYGPDQLVAFSEVAGLLRNLLTRTNLPTNQGEE